jgi:hypothetical protein
LESAETPARFDPFAVSIRRLSPKPSERAAFSDEIHYQIGYGLTLLQEGKLEEAEEAFHAAVVLDPNSSVAAHGLKTAEKLLSEERSPKARRGKRAAASIFDFATYRLKKNSRRSQTGAK